MSSISSITSNGRNWRYLSQDMEHPVSLVSSWFGCGRTKSTMPFQPGNNANPRGRPKGSRDKRLLAREDNLRLITAKLGDGTKLDAHGLLAAVYVCPEIPIEIRVDAAKAAIKFERPALSASNVSGTIEHQVSIAERLLHARRRVDITRLGPPEVLEGEIVGHETDTELDVHV